MIRALLLVVLISCSVSACGRMLPPFAPEDLAPKRVEQLEVVALDSGIQFSWLAPEMDTRGEPLRSLDGYIIERKLIEEPSDVVDETLSYDEVGAVRDSFFRALEVEQKQMKAEGKPTRKARVDDTIRRHTFLDDSLELDNRYLYRVIPINQGGEKGEVSAFVDVEFKGVSSEIVLSEQLGEETDLELEPGEEPFDQG